MTGTNKVVTKIVLDGQEILVDKPLLEDVTKKISGIPAYILCSVGPNQQCEGPSLQAQIEFLLPYVRAGVISGIEIVGVDGDQRHDFKIKRFSKAVTSIKDRMLDLLRTLSATSSPDTDISELKTLVHSLANFPQQGKNKTKRTTSEREFVRAKLIEISKILSALYEANPSALNAIRKFVRHFDLYVSLTALRSTLEYGNRWHSTTADLISQHADVIKIVRWSEVFGVYGPLQQSLDLEELELLTRLDPISPPSAEASAAALALERDAIIQEEVADITATYMRFLESLVPPDTARQARIIEPQINAATQEETLARITELYDDPSSGLAAEVAATSATYLNKGGRADAWLNVIGFRKECCDLASTNYLIEEGAWFGKLADRAVISYPGAMSGAVAKILKILNPKSALTWIEFILGTAPKPAVAPSAAPVPDETPTVGSRSPGSSSTASSEKRDSMEIPDGAIPIPSAAGAKTPSPKGSPPNGVVVFASKVDAKGRVTGFEVMVPYDKLTDETLMNQVRKFTSGGEKGSAPGEPLGIIHMEASKLGKAPLTAPANRNTPGICSIL